MTKAILIDPTEQRKPSRLAVPEIPINSYVRRSGQEAKKYGRAEPGAHLPRHGLSSASSRPCSTASRKRASTRASNTSTRARPTCRSARRRRRSAWPINLTPTTSSLARTAATARSWPRACRPSSKLSDADLLADHGDLPGRATPCASVETLCQEQAMSRSWRSTICSTARWPRSSALHGLQPGHGRLDARLLPALRRHAQQRHRRRLGRHCHRVRRSSSASTASPASSSPTSATPRWAAARSGKA